MSLSPAAEQAFRAACALVAEGRPEAAFPRHREAAEAGHGAAACELGRMYLHGVGAPASRPDALAWFARAEAAGVPAAAEQLAMIALGDDGAGAAALPCDAQVDARLRAAAEAGWPPAMLAAALVFGRSAHPADQERCLRLLQAGAGRGDALAAQLLAARLAQGEGCPPQPEAARGLWAQLAAHGVPALPAFTVDLSAQGGLERTPAGHFAPAAAPHLPPSQMRCAQPRVRTIDGLLSADECRLLIAAARPHLHASRVTDPHSGRADSQPVRTSHDANFDPVIETAALRLVQRRMAAAAGLPLAHAEQLTVLRYTPGQQYRPHRDYLPPGAIARDPGASGDAGNRLRTVCVYLSAVAAGGGTAFPAAGLTVDPQPGRALVFDNLREDGSPEPDSLHAGLPVEAGEKWLATLWIRERRYRAW